MPRIRGQAGRICSWQRRGALDAEPVAVDFLSREFGLLRRSGRALMFWRQSVRRNLEAA